MKRTYFKPLYQFSTRGLNRPEKVKKHADQAVKKIMETCGEHIDIKLHIELESKRKKIYTLSLISKSFENDLVIRKSSRNIYTALRQTKRKFIRSVRRFNSQKLDKKRRLTPHHNTPFKLEEAI